ncbi:MAG: 3-hydroxyacyl-CoA dehydrogenase family protein [Beutenbergiaceae bacterium]
MDNSAQAQGSSEPIREVAVVGAGYMGGGIARSLAGCGIRVRMCDASGDLAQAGRERILAEVGADVAAGLIGADTAQAVAANLSSVDSLDEAVAGAQYVQEVVSESLPLKHRVLAQISAIASEKVIIASNTSSIPVAQMVDAVRFPERFLIVHWSNPAHLVPGVEVIVGEHTGSALLAPIEQMLATAGRICAVVGDTPGFVLNRLQYALVREALLLVQEGHASAEAVDTVLRTTLGFRMAFVPPLTMVDMAGMDVYAGAFSVLESSFGERFTTPAVLTEAVAAGRLGMKNGRGLWRDYPPETLAAINAWRAKAYTAMSALLAELGPAPIPPNPPRKAIP